MRHIVETLVVALSVLVSGCSGEKPTAGAIEPDRPLGAERLRVELVASDRPVDSVGGGRFRTSDDTITLSTGVSDPRYTAAALGGSFLAGELPPSRLSAEYPEVGVIGHARVRPAERSLRDGVASDRAVASVVVTRLQTRDYSITLSAGASGVLYTVASLDGTVLARELPLARLVAEHPQLYESLRHLIAEGQDAPWVGVWD